MTTLLRPIGSPKPPAAVAYTPPPITVTSGYIGTSGSAPPLTFYSGSYVPDSPLPPKLPAPPAHGYLMQKLLLERASVKNYVVLIAAIGIGLSYLGQNIHGALATELFAVAMAIYMIARAYVDGSGNGPSKLALQVTGALKKGQ